MAINDVEKFMASLPNWDSLKGCFGNGGVRPSDVDGWVERSGRSLFLEHKLPTGFIGDGQARGFKALAWQGNSVIVFWSELCEENRIPNEVSKIRAFDPNNPLGKMLDNTSLEVLRELCLHWYSHGCLFS